MSELLKFKVFNGGEAHMGFDVNSVILYGEREAVLIDAQFTLSNGHRLVAEILETGRALKAIYITHFHPDHFLGLQVVHEAFPNARVVSLPQVADLVNEAYDFKIEYWGRTVLGMNGPKSKVKVESLTEPVIMLEGQRLEIVGPFRGDCAVNTVVWIPSIKTLVASDVVFSHSHVWVADDKTPPMRQEWLESLDRLEALGPEVVIPGHAPSAEYRSPDAIPFTREYLKTFIEEMGKASNGQEIMDAMKRRYPDLGTHICLDYSAKILKDHYKWPGEWPQSLREIEAY